MSLRAHSDLERPVSPEPTPSIGAAGVDRDALSRRIAELGEWFHNLDLHGVATAPNHFLGDFPNIKWKYLAHSIP